MATGKRSVLVTGASGFLGGRICHALENEGRFHVKAFVRPSSKLLELPPTVELVYGDLKDYQSLVQAFQGCSAIVHCAALVAPWVPDPSKFMSENVNGLKNVINAVQKTSSIERLVYVSSFFALGPSNGQVADENQVHPGVSFCTEYERSKVIADGIALQEAKRGLPIVLMYPGVLYGPGKVTAGNSLVALLVERCSGRLPGHLGTGEDKFSFCHVDDVAVGCIAAMEKGKQGERYLLTGDNASFDELLDIVDSLRGKKPSWFRTPIWVLNIVGWISVFWAQLTGHYPIISYPISDCLGDFQVSSNVVNRTMYTSHHLGHAFIVVCHHLMVRVLRRQWAYSHEKAKRELGYQSRPLRQGIAEFLTWLESAGLLNNH